MTTIADDIRVLGEETKGLHLYFHQLPIRVVDTDERSFRIAEKTARALLEQVALHYIIPVHHVLEWFDVIVVGSNGFVWVRKRG